jgi:hypothetical protein
MERRQRQPRIVRIRNAPAIDRVLDEARIVHQVPIRNRTLVVAFPEHIDLMAQTENAHLEFSEVLVNRCFRGARRRAGLRARDRMGQNGSRPDLAHRNGRKDRGSHEDYARREEWWRRRHPQAIYPKSPH